MGMSQVVELLPKKYKPLSSNFRTAKKKRHYIGIILCLQLLYILDVKFPLL
jgi:hypothetical protein